MVGISQSFHNPALEEHTSNYMSIIVMLGVKYIPEPQDLWQLWAFVLGVDVLIFEKHQLRNACFMRGLIAVEPKVRPPIDGTHMRSLSPEALQQKALGAVRVSGHVVLVASARCSECFFLQV